MGINVKNRFQAFGFHFLVSFFIVVNFSYVAITNWYPEPFFIAEGGWSILRLIIIVDLILGPVLTLIVFKPGKRGLKFDLSAIATVQIMALAYGVTILYQERPAYLTFAVDRFVIVSEHDIDKQKFKHPELVDKSDEEKPLLVFARMPEDPEEVKKMTEEVFSGKPDLEYRAEYYEPMKGNLESVILKSKDIDKLKNVSEENKHKIEEFLTDHCEEGCGYFPLIGKKNDVLLAINKKDGSVVGGITIDPWVNVDARITTASSSH